MGKVKRLSDRISMIDTFDLGMKGRTSAYVLHEEKLTLIEPSASPSIPHIKSGLAELGLSVSDLEYIIVTHVHLDHAGSAGLLIKECPNAQIAVHPKGVRHLINPERLIAGAKEVYKEHFDSLFAPVLPVPEERILIKKDEDLLEISENCILKFIDTPGHANHHFSIFHPISKGIFTGDVMGILYQDDVSGRFFLPSSSPNQFNPEAMLRSLSRLEALEPEILFFSHFGPLEEPNKAFHDLRKWLPVFLNSAELAAADSSDKSAADQVKATEAELIKQVTKYLDEKNVPRGHPVYDILNLDLAVSAMGLVYYFHELSKGKQ